MSGPGTIQYIRESIKKELAGLYPEREIEAITGVIFLYRLDLKRHETGLRKHEILMPPDLKWFEETIRKLKKGTPVQHITGETHFCDLTLRVSPSALIPRPETEELVQWILDDAAAGSNAATGSEAATGNDAAGSNAAAVDQPGPLRIWDIGTGSGCIALALASKLPGSRICASDISDEALKLAGENSRNLKLKTEFFKHDITAGDPGPERDGNPSASHPVPANLDIIVSNPPYIPLREKEALDPNVKDHDPGEALFVPDEDPLLFYRHLANCGMRYLVDGGMLYLEIHENFAPEVRQLLGNMGYKDLSIKKDIHGKDRMVRARKSQSLKPQTPQSPQ